MQASEEHRPEWFFPVLAEADTTNDVVILLHSNLQK